jgi:hypothetical protein
MANEGEPLRDVAFYYPGHPWHHTDWMKTLLLFCDGIGLLVPEYKQGEPGAIEHVLSTLRNRSRGGRN